LSGEFIIADGICHSQAQFGLRTQVANVLHDASPSGFCARQPNAQSTQQYALVFPMQLFKIEQAIRSGGRRRPKLNTRQITSARLLGGGNSIDGNLKSAAAMTFATVSGCSK
jgi:hypothetical protein